MAGEFATPERSRQLSDEEVVDRWGRLHGIPAPIRLGLEPEAAGVQRQLAVEMTDPRGATIALIKLLWNAQEPEIRGKSQPRCDERRLKDI